MPIVAWYMLSKESYMKRVIRDVFPTIAISCQCLYSVNGRIIGDVAPLCSPRKTSLDIEVSHIHW